MIKRCIVTLLTFAILLSGYVCTSAVSTISFELSNSESYKGRKFDTSLGCSGICELSSFVAEITFDEKLIEYRDAKSVSEEGIISVNSTQEGKIVLVYLCEEGIDCSQGTDLVTLTFKSVAEGNATLSLDVRDAINSRGKDLPVVDTVDAEVISNKNSGKVSSGKAEDIKTSSSEVSASENEDEYSGESDSENEKIVIGGKDISDSTIVSVVVLFVAVTAVVGYTFYKIGVNKEKKKPPLD